MENKEGLPKEVKRKKDKTIFYDKDYSDVKLKVLNKLDSDNELKIVAFGLEKKKSTFFLQGSQVDELIKLLKNSKNK